MKKLADKASFYCLHPWYSLDIGYSGFAKVGCCPFKGRPLKLTNHESLDIYNIWNDKWFQDLRKNSRMGEKIPSGCIGCSRCLRPENYNFPKNLNTLQENNLENCIQEAMANSTKVNTRPSRYNLCFTSRCNIKCIMCSQHDSREALKRELSADLLLNQKDRLAQAASILVSGGEPLISDECLTFIKALCLDPLLQDVRLEIVSNGLLLHKISPFLESKRPLSLHVSMDGTGDTYEKIRKGGSWERISNNMDTILRLSQTKGFDWKISTSCILMRSSLTGLPDYIKWCLERNITIVLQELMVTRETKNEDLKGNPGLLNTIPGWEQKLEDSIDLLANAGKKDLMEKLKQFRSDLITSQRQISTQDRSPSIPDIADYKSFVEGVSCKNKKILIWGTGSNYRYCWSSWLATQMNRIEFIGFTDNDPEHWDTEIDGHPVYSPGYLSKKTEPDYIIVAAQILWRDDIIQQCQKMGWNKCKFV